MSNRPYDPHFQISDEMDTEAIPEEMDTIISLAIRLGMSSAAASLLINAVLLYAKSDHLTISRQGFDKAKARLLKKAVTNREEENQGLFKIDFDGKISEELSVGGRLVKKDHVTCVNGVNGKYIDHFVPKDGTGQSLGIGVANILAATKSLKTCRACGCGK